MLSKALLNALALASGAVACPGHENHISEGLGKRVVVSGPAPPPTDWAYEASFNWGRINPNYTLCQTGTQQSPIALSLNHGLSLNHIVTFDYPEKTKGNFYNWNFGPAFTVSHPDGVWTENPSASFDNTTVYLKGWHIHSPADHSVNGDRSKAELHLVHVDEEGHEKAVMAIRLDPGNSNNTFFDQLPPMIGFNQTGSQEEIEINIQLALDSVLRFNEFWTYQGSLTSPPCREGIRWFVARQVLFTGVEQMRNILGASTYSARAEQEVWQHRINQ
ncbi:Putative alpha carbonic anhydrase domain, carbonic anhydrase, alpha-class [Colletotrichum destructivum]|uniref:Alpha carbonic anhydrase domain, carbonic anhydrase, alpha-class n=1 Tax=Colletotrichum destructivum TaxID=34406 RepID=A0AAX4IC95_9PEZI|nr:Putative alpha carbonic anhydrase domain, carbonic anhydrase, alpha-class [Colletotrichum destructivum]